MPPAPGSGRSAHSGPVGHEKSIILCVDKGCLCTTPGATSAWFRKVCAPVRQGAGRSCVCVPRAGDMRGSASGCGELSKRSSPSVFPLLSLSSGSHSAPLCSRSAPLSSRSHSVPLSSRSHPPTHSPLALTLPHFPLILPHSALTPHLQLVVEAGDGQAADVELARLAGGLAQTRHLRAKSEVGALVRLGKWQACEGSWTVG